MFPESKENVLVVLATGKMGTGVTDAFLATGRHNVFGTSRNANNEKLKAKGITPVGFQFGSKQSMLDALDASKADVVFINTDFGNAAKNDEDTEVEHGKIMIDACLERNVRHVVYCSVFLAHSTPLKEFHGKYRIEQYLASSGLTNYTILRPGCFYDAFDDAGIKNPLTRGKLKYIFAPDVKIASVATFDVGVAAVKTSAVGSGWAGKTLECVEANVTMNECAAALSKASGVQCKYELLLGMTLQWVLFREVYNLSKFCNSGKAQVDTAPFRELVGETAVLSHEMFFAKLGKWGNDDKFGEAPSQEEGGCCVLM